MNRLDPQAVMAWRRAYDAQSAAGKPCGPGQNPARDGCRAKKSAASRTHRAGERKRRELAREQISSVAGESGGAFTRAAKVREIAEQSGMSASAVSQWLDRREGKRANIATKMVRMGAAELEHFSHELEKVGVQSKAARAGIIAGYMAAKTAMAATGMHGPLGIAAHSLGHVADAISYWSGADAMTTVQALHKATKVSVRALKAGVGLLRRAKSGD